MCQLSVLSWRLVESGRPPAGDRSYRHATATDAFFHGTLTLAPRAAPSPRKKYNRDDCSRPPRSTAALAQLSAPEPHRQQAGSVKASAHEQVLLSRRCLFFRRRWKGLPNVRIRVCVCARAFASEGVRGCLASRREEAGREAREARRRSDSKSERGYVATGGRRSS